MADQGRGGVASATAARPHRILIVGGGAGGLELATRLGDKLGRRGKAEVTLIDKARAHLWKPLLHEIAAGSMDLGHHELNYLAQASAASSTPVAPAPMMATWSWPGRTSRRRRSSPIISPVR